MTKLYIKEHVFTLGDKFTVKDEYGNDKYFVEGEIFSPKEWQRHPERDRSRV